MQAYRWARLALLCVGIFSFAQPQVQAAPAAATVLPQTIKSYVSIPDYDQASAHFDETQIGKMMADPVMKPFTDDLKEQIKQKLIAGGVKLGINLDDLKDVYAGEICFANDQPNGEKSDGVVLTVDVTAKKAQVDALLAKITQHQKANGAKESKVTIAGVAATKFDLPPSAEKPGPNEAYYAVSQDLLVATDSEATLKYILESIAAAKQDNLASLEAFKAVLARAAEGRGPETYDFEWFVEPFGYAEVIRSQQGGRKKRGTDMLHLLRNQGFDAVKGLGGYVNFVVANDGDQMEMVHSSFVYAPQDPKAEAGERFRLGARVLNFPNDQNFQPHNWVPNEIATFMDFRWNVQDAFKFSETIVNEYADDEIFDELIESLEKDPAGPKVDVVNQIVKHLDDKVCMLVDVKTPITPQSEQRLVAVHLLNSAPVKAAITQIMQQDPNAEKHAVGDEEIWEIHEEEEEIPTLVISGPGFPDAFAANNQFTQGDANKPKIPNAAVSVVGDWVFFANNKELIKKVILTKQAGAGANLLEQAADYQRMSKALQVLGSGVDSFRHFGRTDQAARVTYELMQQGKMPESESALGKIINELWSMGQEDEQAKRQQQIDASKLPPFAQVEGYLGPTGAYGRTEDNGWYVSGAMLKK
ncbi:hypothetical protein C5Y96_15310 [Blastopirellula marina]|uniref:DUF3352 domain-containing protein n=2 Tax=Pirellulales TaxID=2691354 RepID=A0A2S8FAG7_9BACT|nr:hypothetical protein C5Y96_15310 [Blastopirellula marina]RCS50311.1 hypothetical protein DTL36_15320 [Bremerella cremea]